MNWSGKEETTNYINLSSNKVSVAWETYVTNTLMNEEKFGEGLTINLYNVKDLNGKTLDEASDTSKMRTAVNSFKGTLTCEDTTYSIVTRSDSNGAIDLDKVNVKVSLYGTQAGTVKTLKYARILNSKDLLTTNKERVEYFEKINKNIWNISFDTATFEVRDNGLYLIYAIIEENGVEHKITKYINIKCLEEINPLVANSSIGIYDYEYIVGIEPNTNKADIMNEFDLEKYIIEISDEVIKTGTSIIVKNKDTSEELKEYIVLIYGDVNSDGNINAEDVALIKAYINNSLKNNLSEISKMVADMNRDGKISEEDMETIILHYLQKENEIIYQKDYVN